MTKAPNAPLERIGYRRSDAVPGLSVLDAHDSPREWRDVGTGFAVTYIRDWHGQVYYRGRSHQIEPGIAFCNHPEEALVATPRPGTAGSFNVVIILAEALQEWLSEYQPGALRPHWRGIASRISGQFGGAMERFLSSFEPQASALEVQSNAAILAQSLIKELITGANEDPLHVGPAIRGTARMRECLNEEGFDIDLDTLAERAGMGRYQALRAFKRRYGLPPHAYQVCMRVFQAKRLLMQGYAPTHVAMQTGFVDQSHFTRHFKRIVGVTPSQYVVTMGGSRMRASGVFTVGNSASEDVSSIVTRSDHRRA